MISEKPETRHAGFLLKRQNPRLRTAHSILFAATLLGAALWVSGCVVHGHGRGPGRVVVQPRAAVQVSPAPVTFVFTDHHRHTVRSYYGRHVPPGHTKHKWKKKRGRGRGRGGPPGWVHKGGHMPPGIAMQSIPNDLAVQLPPPPRGTQFIFYSDHVLLVDVHSHAVLDSISISVGF